MVFRISRRVAERARPQSTSQKIAQQRPMMQERGKARVRMVRGIRLRIKTPTRTTRTRKAPPSNNKVLIEEESAAAESSSSQTAPPAADLKALMGEVGKALKAFSPSNMKTLIIEEGGEEKAPKWDCSPANIEHLPQTAHRKMAHEETDNAPVCRG